jgi:hypothetical protein
MLRVAHTGGGGSSTFSFWTCLTSFRRTDGIYSQSVILVSLAYQVVMAEGSPRPISVPAKSVRRLVLTLFRFLDFALSVMNIINHLIRVFSDDVPTVHV